MSSFADETAALIPVPFVLPAEFRALFDWVEANGWIGTYPPGWAGVQPRFAALHPLDRHLGSAVEFRVLLPVGGVATAAPWLGSEQPGTADRILPFARIGGDGSEAAFWIDEQGRQRIVILGSGSGSILACVLADEPVDFLRLIAIGYPDVCWAEEWTSQPVQDQVDWPTVNEPYRRWLTATFGVTIPETASEIVPRPAEHGDTDSDDDFTTWLNSLRDDL